MLANPLWPEPNFVLLSNALKQTNWTGPGINSKNWKDIIALHIKSMDWKRALEDVSAFLEREGDEYLLTLENCNNLLSKFNRM